MQTAADPLTPPARPHGQLDHHERRLEPARDDIRRERSRDEVVPPLAGQARVAVRESDQIGTGAHAATARNPGSSAWR